MEGTHPIFFNIADGQLSVSETLHYGEVSTFMVTVVATDQYGARDTVAVTVNVTTGSS